MTDKEKTRQILEQLINLNTAWGKSRTNVLFPELRLGSGYSGVAQRRIDLFVISSNAGNETTAYEIKASRADFKKDISDPLKQRGARLYSNYFYYVAPKGMIKADEIPLWAGLMELDLESNVFHTVVPAPLQPKSNPSWGLICAIIRHVNKDLGKERIEELEKKVRNLEANLSSAKCLLNSIANGEEVYDFQLASYRSIQ